MKGRILEFNFQTGEGIISGEDGIRYHFNRREWRDATAPMRGDSVDFVGNGNIASDIYALPTDAVHYEKSKVAAALLALFLGAFGIHKFYLGYTAQGVIMLVGTIAGAFLMLVLIGFFIILAISIIAIVEFVLYLTKSDEEFHEIYVVNNRPWF